MVVADDGFGQFIAGEIVGADHPLDDANRFEVGHVAVERALGEARARFEEFGHRRWTPGGGQKINKLTSTLGIELARLSHSTCNQVVNFGDINPHSGDSTLHSRWPRPSLGRAFVVDADVFVYVFIEVLV